MSKRPSSTQEHVGGPHKRSKISQEKSKAVSFVDLEAEVASEDKDDEEENEDVSDNIMDDESNDNAVHPLSPLKDVGAWDIFWEHLTTDMSFEDMLNKLHTYLDIRYCKEDWKEVVDSLFSGDGDIDIVLDNLAGIKARYILVLSDRTSVSPLSSRPVNIFMKAVEDIDKRFSQGVARPPHIISDDRECDDRQLIAPRKPGEWLVTVPASKTSFLAASIQAFGLQTYTHPTLHGRFAHSFLMIRLGPPPWPFLDGIT
ncbi:hypothetical protein CY34DRAFT_18564 [Suillus luteus UH-Slu-Lm8-n1]|uniref:Uncharacterized protein n=1 Tax=Suillus luteus UH-Slu-Lm8-n1 TaxID=930992 RepID=A0A0C9ZUT0_9AGAM|nr:hypothetical protein CY34DRAFT_18564 [Suillus luteus UH-Slu-Lm8-n1]